MPIFVLIQQQFQKWYSDGFSSHLVCHIVVGFEGHHYNRHIAVVEAR